MELVHAKMERGVQADKFTGEEHEAYIVTFVFGSPFTDSKGKHIGGAKPVNMAFMNGMPPEDFATGLRALADHVDNEFSSEVSRNLRLVDTEEATDEG